MLTAKSGLIIEADRRRPVAAMRKAAKAAGGSAKGVWGTVQLNGKVLVIKSEIGAPGAFDKTVKKHFADLGQSLQVQIEAVDPNASADDEVEEKEEKPKPGAKANGAGAEDAKAEAKPGGLAKGPKAAEDEAAPDAETGEYPEDPEDPDDAEDVAAHEGGLKEIIAAARKKPFNFAWLVGKEGMILKAHRRKPAAMLVQQAKAEGASARGAWGKLSVEGKWVVLNCEDDPPGNMVQLAKQHLKSSGATQGVLVRSPQGEASAGPEEDEEVSAEDVAAVLMAEYNLIEGPLDEIIAAADKGPAKKLEGLKAMFRAAMEAGDASKAQKILTLIKQTAGLKDTLSTPVVTPPKDVAMSEDQVLETLKTSLRGRVDAVSPAAQSAEFDEEKKALHARITGATDTAQIEVLSEDIGTFEDRWRNGADDAAPALQGMKGKSVEEILGISEDKALELQQWAKDMAMAEEGVLGDEVGGEKLAEALKGKSDLGALSDQEKQYLVVMTANSWIEAPADPDNPLLTVESRVGENLEELTASVKGDPDLSGLVAGALWASHASRETFVGTYQVIEPARDISHEIMLTALDLDPELTTKMMMMRYGPKSVAQLAMGDAQKQILTVDIDNPDIHERNFDALSEERRNALLTQIGSGKYDPQTTNTVTSYMFDAADEDDVDSLESQRAMADALTRTLSQSMGMKGRAASRTKDRIRDVIATDGGQELLFNRAINPALRNWALTELTAVPGKSFPNPIQLENGWESNVIAEAYGKKTLELAKTQFPEPKALDLSRKEATVNSLGSLLGMQADVVIPENETEEETIARLKKEEDFAYYDASKPPMSKIMGHVAASGKDPAEVTPIPVSVTSNEFGAAMFRVLRIETEKGPHFIDDKGNRYLDVATWVTKNELPPGTMCYPAGLALGGAPKTGPTPKNTTGAKVLDAADKAAVAIGVTAGIVAIAASGGTATPLVVGASVAMGATGVYSTARSVSALDTKSELGHDIWDAGDPEMRGMWLDLGSNALSIGALGGGVALTKGVIAGRSAANLVAGMQVAGNLVDAAAMANTISTLSVKWDKMTEAQKAQALLSLSFQAGMGTAARKKSGGTLADDFSFTRTRNQLEHGTPFNLERDTTLPEGGVKATWDPHPTTGEPTNIRLAYNSDKMPSREMIALHGRAAASMEASLSMKTKLLNAFKGKKPAPAGSAAWEATEELKKFADETQGIIKKLNNPDLSPEDRIMLEARIDEINVELINQRARLDKITEPGSGLVAAPQTGAQQAAALKFPDPPTPSGRGKADYIWVAGNPEPHLRPLHDDVPPCRLENGKFVYKINRGWTSDTETDFNWYANNPEPNAKYEYENGATYSTDDKGRTSSLTARLRDDPWDRDESTQRAIGQVGKAGNPGESYDGGHLIPRELGGAPGKLNVVPMQSYLNQHGEWRKIERSWRDMVKGGKDVQVKIDVEYYKSGNAARQATPKSFTVVTTIDGVPQPAKVIKNLSSG
ncbi:DNA/RNA non-specific endonuclease [uncultured Tateyamaria sp.]|uniref:DNA/RNA non-specific endonuclease n=1 Tax=uncultured Tateyamaria sp. TaxID=455651 RepID=UPI002603DDE5|nr:DNA/RNA non-specific endonuclease [uncultured Tateyamaria sp.]